MYLIPIVKFKISNEHRAAKVALCFLLWWEIACSVGCGTVLFVLYLIQRGDCFEKIYCNILMSCIMRMLCRM